MRTPQLRVLLPFLLLAACADDDAGAPSPGADAAPVPDAGATLEATYTFAGDGTHRTHEVITYAGRERLTLDGTFGTRATTHVFAEEVGMGGRRR